MIFRGVEYSSAGEALMRALGRLWRATDDPAEKAALNNEANVIHAFHAEFPGDKHPGLIFHESGRDPQAASDQSGGATPLAVVSPVEEPASRPASLFEDGAA